MVIKLMPFVLFVVAAYIHYKNNTRHSTVEGEIWLYTKSGLICLLSGLAAVAVWLFVFAIESEDKFSIALNILGFVLLVLSSIPLFVFHFTHIFIPESGMGRTFDEDPTGDPLEYALAAENRGDIAAATERYIMALKINPELTRARLKLAILLAEGGKRVRALRFLDEGLRLLGLPKDEVEIIKVLHEKISDPSQQIFNDIAKNIETPMALKGLEKKEYVRASAIEGSNSDDALPIPFDFKEEEEEEEYEEEDDDSPIKV